MIWSDLKWVRIGHISQKPRPKSMIVPIPFWIVVDISKSFATTWLVDHLTRFGFSISSDEVNLIRHLEIASNAMNTVKNPVPFTQWVADNVSHNIQRLTGKETFHRMGIISICTSLKTKFHAAKRLKLNEKVNPSNAYVKMTP